MICILLVQLQCTRSMHYTPQPQALTLNYITIHCMHLLPISLLLVLRRFCSHTSEQMFIPAKLLCCQQSKSSGDCADTWKVFTNRRTSPRNEWPLFASHFWLSSRAASWEQETLRSRWVTLRALTVYLLYSMQARRTSTLMCRCF